MGSNESNQSLFVGDKALKTPDQDEFGRAEFAKRIVDILIQRNDSDHLTIGIYGKWGEGKTSVVNFIKYYLDEHGEIIHLDFNPWRFSNENELLNSFFKQFAQGVTKKLGEQGKKIAKAILIYSGTILAFAEPMTGLAILSNLGWIDKVKKFIKSTRLFTKENDFGPVTDALQKSLERSTELEKQKENISAQLEKTGKKHVVFIDDIDRLDNEEIRTLFRLIKLTADFDHVIYGLSFDPEMVAAALDDSYPGDKDKSGINFLEKIVQIPLTLPKVRRTDLLNDVLYPGIDRILENNSITISKEDARNIGDALSSSLEKRLSTPRMVKRYLNGLTFAIPILKGEANPHDIILLEGLRICYPEAYDFVYRNREVFISDPQISIYPSEEEIQEEHKRNRDDFFEGRDSDLQSLLEKLFPRIGSPGLLGISEKDLARHQRICSPYYFDRYFSYSIPKQDIGDRDFQEFLASFSEEGIDVSLQKAQELIEATSGDVFIRKIEENKELILNSYDPDFAILLANLGKYFSKRNTALDFSSTLRRASALIKELILKAPQNERYALIEEALDQSSNIVLSAEVGRYLHKDSNKERILSDQEHQELIELVSEKIKNDAQNNGPFYMREETRLDSALLFNLWNAGAPEDDEVSEYIKEIIDNSPDKAIQFLKSFMQTAYSPEDDTTEFGRFGIDQYNSVKKLVDPEIIYDVLKKDYLSEMEKPENVEVIEKNGGFDKALAKNFAYFCINDKKENDQG